MTDVPVSAMSVKVWGDAAWHSQPKKAEGAPATFSPWMKIFNIFTMVNICRNQFSYWRFFFNNVV